jgi:hypothetical protein
MIMFEIVMRNSTFDPHPNPFFNAIVGVRVRVRVRVGKHKSSQS